MRGFTDHELRRLAANDPVPFITERGMIEEACGLLEPGWKYEDNPEYTRALIELIVRCFGHSHEDEQARNIERLLCEGDFVSRPVVWP